LEQYFCCTALILGGKRIMGIDLLLAGILSLLGLVLAVVESIVLPLVWLVTIVALVVVGLRVIGVIG